MTGICAGDKDEVQLGDLVVADRTFIYDEGKVKSDQNNQSVLHPDLKTYVTHPEILHAVRMFDGWKPLVAMLGRPLPTCHVTAIASGNAVRSDNPFKQIQRAVRNAIALDMEGAAFYRCIADFPVCVPCSLKAFVIMQITRRMIFPRIRCLRFCSVCTCVYQGIRHSQFDAQIHQRLICLSLVP